MNRIIQYSLCALCIAFIASCNRNTGEVVTEQGSVAEAELVRALDTLSKREFQSFFSKISTSYQDSSRNVSFKTSAWMVADSASNFLITYASFPIVGALVTTDSVHVTNKREKCYTKASLAFLREQFGIEFTLKNLEDILLGVPTNYDPTRTYYQVDSKNGRTLCTHGMKDIEQIKLEGSDEIVMYYKLNEDLSELAGTTVVSFTDSTEVSIVYNSREMIKDFNIPTSVTIHIVSPKQDITVDLSYTKTRLNDPENIHFIIPDSYEECNK